MSSGTKFFRFEAGHLAVLLRIQDILFGVDPDPDPRIHASD